MNTGLHIVNEPAIRNVPLASVRNPSVSAVCPRTAKPGASSVRLALVPLLAVTARTFVTVPPPVIEAFVAPVNVSVAPAALPLVLKSSVP